MTAARTLTVFIDELLIADGAMAPPRIGDVLAIPVEFSPAPFAGIEPQTDHVLVDPNDTVYIDDTGPVWNGLLRGDGWVAGWSDHRPMIGNMRVAGYFRYMHGDHRGRVRGRVTRIRMVRQEMVGASTGNERYPVGWKPSPQAWVAEDLEVSPRHFPRGDIHERIPTIDERTEIGLGLLVDLDLDDVAPPATRDSSVPGSVSAHGTTVWTADSALPIVSDGATEYLLPARIGVRRRVHAIANGCWVTGSDGLFWCEPGETPGHVCDMSVSAAATSGDSILTINTDGRWRVHRLNNTPIEVIAPEGHCFSVIGRRSGGFVAVLAAVAAGTSRLCVVTADGGLTLGPAFDSSPGTWPILGGDPLNLLMDSNIHRVNGDLTLGAPTHLGPHVGGSQQFPNASAEHLVWTVRGREQSLIVIDPVTHVVVQEIPVGTTSPSVTMTSDNRLHIVAGGNRPLEFDLT